MDGVSGASTTMVKSKIQIISGASIRVIFQNLVTVIGNTVEANYSLTVN